MKLFTGFSLFVLINLSTIFAHAQDCGTETAAPSGVSFDYCLYPSPNSQDIMWYFHGANGSEKNWKTVDPYIKVREHWAATSKTPPTVIAVSFGGQWILTDVEKNKSLYNVFINEILPMMEAKVPNRSGRRILMGESMGGLNSSILFTKNPGMFERVALNCPAIVPIGPYDKEAIDAYVERHKDYINRWYVMYMINWGKSEFPTTEDFLRNAPLELAKNLPKTAPPVYVSCGTRDQFGFIEGAFLFADYTRWLGIPTTWVPIEGAGHCTINSQTLADFLIPN